MDPNFSFDTPDENSTAAAEELLQQMPEIQQHAIDQHNAEIAEAEANTEVDSAGVAFDAKLHTGSKLKDGTWRKRKNAGEGGSIVAKPRGRKSAAGETVAAPAVDTNAEAMATGQVIATLFLGMCQSIGGEEWEPTQQERDFQTAAWQSYCVAKNMRELSPGLALTVAIGSYAAPRFVKPKTAAKLGRIKTWIALRIARRKVQAELKKRGIDAKVQIVDGELHLNGKPMDPATLQ